jgi:ectoine hydroxylase-related dioxygenase (phytanoyl-CoA dioxygenase family)
VAVDDLLNLGAKLIETDAGNMLIFHENILHGGVVNQGTKTRVSAEITMVISDNYHHPP